LTALRPFVANGCALVCVFGCGGDRDKGKRAEMGTIAGNLADPRRHHDRQSPIRGSRFHRQRIAQGIRGTANRRWNIELDRAAAIKAAIAGANVGDVVLIAGKGHEDYQERNGVRHPFSDAEVANAALGALTHS
jgi:UDP-N-acetylmuramoyl-L-alanyl-D-glutamate--2,6-diaminopimelate ligase